MAATTRSLLASTSMRAPSNAANNASSSVATTRARAAMGASALHDPVSEKGASNVDSRKRKRGALQDISNRNTNAAKATGKDAISKAKVSKTTANTNAKLLPLRATKSHAKSVAKKAVPVTKTTRKRKHDSDANGNGAPAQKRQTSLLSFPSITSQPVRVAGKKEAKTQKNEVANEVKDKTDAVRAKESKPGIAARIKTEHATDVVEKQSTFKPAVTATSATTTHIKTESKVKTETRPSTFPRYEPRQYPFKFDHRDSGFDPATYSEQITDIDALHREKAAYCTRIAVDIERFHRMHECKYMPPADYIGKTQTDISEKMRTILVDWLVEVGEEYDLDSRTFHKAVNLVDRCLSSFPIHRKQFQLLGCACMMVASKYEEVYGPTVEEFVYISDQTYTAAEMLEMERKVLGALEYRVGSTTCHGFLERFMRAGCDNDAEKKLVLYLSDFALLFYSMLRYKPSEIAASAVYLARVMTKHDQAWTPTLHHVTQYNAWDLKPCIDELFRFHRLEHAIVRTDREKAKAVSEKYFADKFYSVSAIEPALESTLEQSFLSYTRRRSASVSEPSSSPVE